MSLIRIVLGVLVAGSIVAGLLVAAVNFPTVAGFLMFGTAGGLILFMAWRGLKTGAIRARRSRYERRGSPWGFWFYIGFYAFLGALVFGYGAYCAIAPLFARQ